METKDELIEMIQGLTEEECRQLYDAFVKAE